MKIVVISTGLKVGGAETLLLALVKQWLKSDIELAIFSLSGENPLDHSFRDLGVEVRNYNIKSINNFFPGLISMVKDLRAFNPQIVQTWMTHADLIGGLIARLTSDAKLVWAIHHGNFTLKTLKWHTLVAFKLTAILSRIIPHKVIAVSSHVHQQLRLAGFDGTKLVTVENGIDCSRFTHIRDAKKNTVKELGIEPSNKIIGFVGRYSFEKRVKDFVHIAAALAKDNDDYHFIMVGNGNVTTNLDLAELIQNHGLASKVSLLGIRKDMPELFSSMDLLISTSSDEAFGLALVEGMACGCPSISSDNKGARAVGETYVKFAKIGDVAGFCDEAREILSRDAADQELWALKANAHVKENFEITVTASKYLSIYAD